MFRALCIIAICRTSNLLQFDGFQVFPSTCSSLSNLDPPKKYKLNERNRRTEWTIKAICALFIPPSYCLHHQAWDDKCSHLHLSVLSYPSCFISISSFLSSIHPSWEASDFWLVALILFIPSWAITALLNIVDTQTVSRLTFFFFSKMFELSNSPTFFCFHFIPDTKFELFFICWINE